MATSPPPHASLVRAAAVEEERVDRALQQLSHRRDTLAAEIAGLEAQMNELQERRRLLEMLVDRPDDEDAGRSGAVTSRAGVTPVRGRQLRLVAAQLLARWLDGDEIHYREWFERLLREGYAVGGRDPLASFLTNVRDSPAVVRGSRQGYYRLDPSRRKVVAREIGEAEAELADIEVSLSRAREENDNARVEQLRAHRDGVVATLKRLEARRDELAAIFESV
jgi:DNA repair exonuclease SbcCD ATPase subunit